MPKSPPTVPRLALLAAVALAAGLALPTIAGAQLSDVYTEWRDSPVQVLMLPEEEKAWEEVATDEEAETFIRLFWARRDPTPGTALNEFRRDFEQRVAFAQERFAEEDREGALTDRGRVFLLLGPPRRIQSPGAGGVTTGGDAGSGEDIFGGGGSIQSGAGRVGRGGGADRMGVASEERWIYEDDRKPDFIKVRRYTVRFLTKPGTDEVELRDGEQTLGYMAEARQVAVAQPDLTAADLPSMTAGGGAPAGGSGDGGEAMAWMGEEVTGPDAVAALRAALADSGGAAGGGSLPAHLDAGAYEASDGRWIVPFQVSTTADPGAETARVVGELVPAGDAAAEPVVAFRLEQSWTESKGQRIVKDTLVVPPGDYELRVGVEDASGAIRWAGSEPVEVPGGGDDFWVSELVFSDSIYPMEEAQQMLEPYAWQGIVVVPKGDRTFAQGGVMWFYVHACQAALDEAGKPDLKITAKVEGPSRLRNAVPVEPVRAGDDCWVIASGVDLAANVFPPGDYEMSVLVRDATAGKTLSSKGEFTVTAP